MADTVPTILTSKMPALEKLTSKTLIQSHNLVFCAAPNRSTRRNIVSIKLRFPQREAGHSSKKRKPPVSWD